MSYELRLSPKADRQFSDVPNEFVAVVEENLRRLADSPTTWSERIASPPFAPRGQLFHFRAVAFGGTSWFFAVNFQYSQDEIALYVLSITWRELTDE